MITHFLFDRSFSFGFADVDGPTSMLFVCRSARTRFVKTRSTFSDVFADVSMNSHPNCRASAAPSSLLTSRSWTLSHLFPTSIKIGSPLLTLLIDCLKPSSRLKVARDAIEYTRIKPWPSLKIVQGVTILTQIRPLTGPTDHAAWHIPLTQILA